MTADKYAEQVVVSDEGQVDAADLPNDLLDYAQVAVAPPVELRLDPRVARAGRPLLHLLEQRRRLRVCVEEVGGRAAGRELHEVMPHAAPALAPTLVLLVGRGAIRVIDADRKCFQILL